MLTFEDCLGFADLTEEEILAIAEHENLPEAAALELGHHLMQTRRGAERIRRIIVEDIARAHRHGDLRRGAELSAVLERFCAQHPLN